MHDYFATLKVQHGRIVHLMHEMGIRSVSELSRISGVSLGTLHDYVNFRRRPRDRNGAWKASALKLCTALVAEPSDVFPDHLNHEVLTNRIQQFTGAPQLSGFCPHGYLPSGEVDEIDDETKSAVLDDVLSSLSRRQAAVLRARFYDGKTQAEVAQEHGVPNKAIWAAERNALQNMRNKRNMAKLKVLRQA